MVSERSHGLTSFIFHALLLIVPLDVRREYGPQIWRDFTRALSEREQAGSLAWMWLFLCVCGDLVAIGLRERYAAVARDVVFALRSLRKTPLFTIIIIATLAVAIAETP